MAVRIFIFVLALTSLACAQSSKVPIKNGYLQSDLDCNSKNLLNVNRIDAQGMTLGGQDIYVIIGSGGGGTLPTTPWSRNFLSSATAITGRMMVSASNSKVIHVSYTYGTNTRTFTNGTSVYTLSVYDVCSPYASLTAAESAASSGDTVVVWDGSFNETIGAKTLVWAFMPGSGISRTSGYAINLATSVIMTLSGGSFYSADNNAVNLNTSSKLVAEGAKFQVATGSSKYALYMGSSSSAVVRNCVLLSDNTKATYASAPVSVKIVLCLSNRDVSGTNVTNLIGSPNNVIDTDVE